MKIIKKVKMYSKRKLRQLYRRYLFSYSFEVFIPKPITELEPRFKIFSSADDEQILASVASLLLV